METAKQKRMSGFSFTGKTLVAFLFFLVLPVYLFCQKAGIGTDELIVMFVSNQVNPPQGENSGQLGDFTFEDNSLGQLLSESNVSTMTKLHPDFSPSDKYQTRDDGIEVELTDWTDTYVVSFGNETQAETFLNEVGNHPKIIFAEPNGETFFNMISTDQKYYLQFALNNTGAWYQGGGNAGADIDIERAWNITTGSSNVKIGIVDSDVDGTHDEFAGRLTGGVQSPPLGHGTAVAGIAAADGNNGTGIAGVAWNVLYPVRATRST